MATEKIDYSKMKKEDLIKELENQKHLKEAVEAKDKQIADIKKHYKEKIEDIRATYSDEKKSIVIKKEDDYKEKLEKIEEKYKKELEEKDLMLSNTKLLFDYQKIVTDRAVNQYSNFMKVIQGTLDTHLEFSAYLQKEFNVLKEQEGIAFNNLNKENKK